MLLQPVLQQQAVGYAAAAAMPEGRSGPPVGMEAIGAGRRGGKIVWVVGMCGAWAGTRNTEGQQTEKKNRRKQNASAQTIPSTF